MSEPAARARVIATALARTAERHRKTALMAAVIALGGCALAALAGPTAAKAGALALAVLFFVFAYRALRAAARCLEPAGSPVLQAITQRPGDIARIHHDAGRATVVVSDRSGNALALHLDAATAASTLIDALAAHAPEATVERPDAP
jgi:hypothetical protein